jgi:hypothetical protein
MRPFFARNTWMGYPIFASVTASFGYYLEDVEARQFKILEERKARLLEKRKRQAERDAAEGMAVDAEAVGKLL